MSQSIVSPRALVRTLVVSVPCLVLALHCGWLSAANKAERQDAAQQLISEALHLEIYGESAERARLLDEALAIVPDYAPAMWQRGYVRYQNRWVTVDEFVQRFGQESRRAAYQRTREKYPETVAGQMELANWCSRRGLADEERAHLTQVVALDPDHLEARRRLGFVRVGGMWVSLEEIERAQSDSQSDREALAKWRPTIEGIRRDLHRDRDAYRERAREKLLAIDDPDAAVAIERILADDSEPAALLAVEALGAMYRGGATTALARLAVFSPWEQVRGAAAEQLRDRPFDSFVPDMLATMYTPATSRIQLFRGEGGRLVYRHAFVREGQNQREAIVLDTAVRRVAQPGGDRNETMARALFGTSTAAQQRQWTLIRQNEETRRLNDRVIDALSAATGEQGQKSPEWWWQWWNDYNQILIDGEKPTRTQRYTQEIALVDRTSGLQSSGSGTGGSTRTVQRMYECLKAGTPVMTATGPQDVEKIRVGDLVLSQHPDTGELAFKPVLRTTVRPQEKLIAIQAGCETITCSAGHPFWVAGEGWVLARNLKPGAELHAIRTTVRVSTIDDAEAEETYNLIVADFHTYFAGGQRVLTHDNTVRGATDAVVPGLVEE